MNIPKTVTICGYKIAVHRDHETELSDQRYGSYHYTNKCIHLQPSMEKQKEETTFLHECLHGMLLESGAARCQEKFTEEDICTMLAPALWNFIKDNPSIFSTQ